MARSVALVADAFALLLDENWTANPPLDVPEIVAFHNLCGLSDLSTYMAPGRRNVLLDVDAARHGCDGVVLIVMSVIF
jgi:hypothetical protein